MFFSAALRPSRQSKIAMGNPTSMALNIIYALLAMATFDDWIQARNFMSHPTSHQGDHATRLRREVGASWRWWIVDSG